MRIKSEFAASGLMAERAESCAPTVGASFAKPAPVRPIPTRPGLLARIARFLKGE